MDDWKLCKNDAYKRIMLSSRDWNFELRIIARRVQENKDGIYETLKTYVDGYSINDGSWLIYNTSRTVNDKYKDKVFCQDKEKVIKDLYSYILFLRNIGIDVLWEMSYYAIAFLFKYLRFYDRVFDCNRVNQELITDICRKVIEKDSEDIECSTRKDPREFALDPDSIKNMDIGQKTRFQKKIQKKMTDDRIKELYNQNLSVRKNIEEFKKQGLEISVGRLQQWIKEYMKK